jgi:FkbH-like protein
MESGDLNKMSMEFHGVGPEAEIETGSGTAPQQRLVLIADWAVRCGPPDPALVQRLSQFAASLVITCEWAETAGQLRVAHSPMARWFAAALFEANGDFATAAEVLDSFSCSHSRPAEALRLLGRARTLVGAGRTSQAVAPLKRAVRLSESCRFLTACGKLKRQLDENQTVPYARTCRLAMLGNATFDFLLPVLKTVAFASGIDLITYSGAYNQHVQEVLDNSSRLYEFKPDIVVLAADWRSLALPEEAEDRDGLVAQKLHEITRLWESVSSRLRAHVIQHNFVVPEISPYAGLSGRLPGGRANVIRQLNLKLAAAAHASTGVTVLDVEEVASLIGKRNWDDPRMWIAAKQYPAAEAAGMLASHQVALLRAILGLSSKCVVLDLDNTLWGGVIGEDGLEGIRLGGSAEGEAFVEFQRYLSGLRERGIVLAVCSKNNESDAKLPFQQHPEMVLRLDDISVFVANWLPKAENLRTIAAKLNVGIDSLVFIDDNPAERELVRKQISDVYVPELPSDPSLFVQALHREGLFEALTLTSEDKARAGTYRANVCRENLRSGSSSIDEFLESLQMRMELRPFDGPNLPRIVQLINKTNQFNLTTLRMTTEQVKSFAAVNGSYTQFMHLYDRFDDNGITGLIMASSSGEELTIDLWVLSCRVLGRRAEEAMLASVWNSARKRGFKRLRGMYKPSLKNQQVADLYDRMGFQLVASAALEKIYIAELTADRAFPQFIQVDDFTAREAVAIGQRA